MTPADLPTPAATEPGHARRWSILAALWLCVLVIGFDVTILNVALPTLAPELDASTSQLQWIVDAYAIRRGRQPAPASA